MTRKCARETGAILANERASCQFIVMFRSRFNDAFPKNLSNFGPQELEQEVVDQPPGDRVEYFLCALLGLLLNRKQDVKYAAHAMPPRPSYATGRGD